MTRALAPVAASEAKPLELAAQSALPEASRAPLRSSSLAASGPATAPGADPAQLKQLLKVSQDFESLFLSYMLKVGREATLKGNLMGHTQGEEIFTEMRDDELAKRMSSAGGIGLARLLVEQLTRTLQAQARDPSAPSGVEGA